MLERGYTYSSSGSVFDYFCVFAFSNSEIRLVPLRILACSHFKIIVLPSPASSTAGLLSARIPRVAGVAGLLTPVDLPYQSLSIYNGKGVQR
jgi:hypothetical protein